jgi:LPPG:FO 2-phospho-L-lactate transferase
MPDVVVLAGGVGGGRFLRGVRAWAARTGWRVTAVVNVADNITLHGLRICPDLDTVLYTLGGGADPDRGWGREAETWTVRQELAAYDPEAAWFGLGDKDLAIHLIRTGLLAAGRTLSEVTEVLCRRWRPGVRILPASDDPVETRVRTPDGDLHFQEWWVRHRAVPKVIEFAFAGASSARPAPGVVPAIAGADLVLIGPSNPVVSIGPILAVPGVRDAVVATAAPVIGVSPIIGGAPVLGMADRCLSAIGVECTAAGVGVHYGARGSGGLLDGWLVDTGDAATGVPGVRVRAVPLWMTDEQATLAMVAAAASLAGVS